MLFNPNLFLNSVLILIIFWLSSYIITIFLNILDKYAQKTKNTFDDRIVEAAKLPIRYLFIIFGFYFAIKNYQNNLSFVLLNKKINIEDIFYSFIVLLFFYALSRFLKIFFSWWSEKEKGIHKFNRTMFVFIQKTISVFVYIIAALLILSNLDIKIGPMLAGLGVVGLAIALGLQETLANLFAAFFLAMDKSINIGDWIKLEDGSKAFIEDISWRSIRIRTISGNSIILPNSIFINQKISSYDYPESSFFTNIKIGVSFDSDLEKVEKIAIQAGKNTKKINKGTIDGDPLVRFTEFGESAIYFILIIKINDVRQEGKIKHDLIKEVKFLFEKEKIEIPFPKRVIYQKK